MSGGPLATVPVDPSFADWTPTCVLCGKRMGWNEALLMPCSPIGDAGDDDIHAALIHRYSNQCVEPDEVAS